jgi:hypothetical protein
MIAFLLPEGQLRFVAAVPNAHTIKEDVLDHFSECIGKWRIADSRVPKN